MNDFSSCPSDGQPCNLKCHSGFPARPCDPVKATPIARKPRLLILGHARHGKDTVAELLRDNHGYTFASSSYFLAEVAVRPALAAKGITYHTLDECYADRVNHRAAWYDAISEYNGEDPSRLAKAILAEHAIYVGMRSNREYEAARPLFDAVLWVNAYERTGMAEPRSSMDIDYDPTCMVRVENNGSPQDLARLIDFFALNLPWSSLEPVTN